VTVSQDELTVVVAPGHPWTRRRSGITAAELAGTALVTRKPDAVITATTTEKPARKIAIAFSP